VAINCGGIPETLLESELFGYKKGAFTGAVEDKEGLFVVANGGTIFLDEIGELPLMLQVKLLRVLDNSTVTPVGGTNAVSVDVRIISATNRNLKKMAEEGTFRKDLYYRLNVIPLTVPPLRNRVDDIPLLARHFVRKHAEKMGRERLDIAPAAMGVLQNYSWPGNVRELGNVIERVMALCSGSRIEAADLPEQLQDAPLDEFDLSQELTALPPGGLDLERHVAELEKSLIKQALERGRHSHIRAARLLGLKNARVLRHRLQKYGMEEGE
jgi:transcriptional regulator with PAS, ATPase and Fis domain